MSCGVTEQLLETPEARRQDRIPTSGSRDIRHSIRAAPEEDV